MAFRKFLIVAIALAVLTNSCTDADLPWGENAVTIDIQPFDAFPKYLTKQVATQLTSIGPKIIIKERIDLPPSSLYLPNRRYRADTIVNILHRSTPQGHITLGLTNYDISTTKGKIRDWGIMGLGQIPGNACVVSTYRLKQETLDSQLYKVCIHELGHTAGLNHCPVRNCFMRDAEGGNPIDDEVKFCNKCSRFLKAKGWRI